ncbi:MAG: ATP-binding cassette domain-containing protein [Gammaproteobacteria bacterium]|nr:ATP-binding cassette domain-containing protein [Gammaproteobacteria bacterium]
MTGVSDNLLELRGIRFGFGRNALFSDTDIAIERGSVTVIMGPSGCGKSTLLALIGGRLRPWAGSIMFDGEELRPGHRQSLYRMRRKMGMLFQSSALLTDLNVFENVAFPLREHTRLSEELVAMVVLMKLQMVGLRGAAMLMPSELSGGMARRVALARSIALDPLLVMYDEPFTGLDPISMGVAVKLIRELNDALGTTSVVVTHDVDEGCSIADYVYILGKGSMIGQGTVADLGASDDPQVRQFMDGLPDGPVPYHYPAPAFADELMGNGQ